MKYMKFWLSSLLIMVMAIGMTGCSDDTPAPKHNDALYGIYSRDGKEFMEIDDLDWIYQYNLEEYNGTTYWVKRKLSYLFEPVSDLVLREDAEGILQLDKVITNTPKELTLCWVETPLTEETDDDAKFAIIQVFFNQDFKIDPANYRTYERITADQLKAGLSGHEVIEAY